MSENTSQGRLDVLLPAWEAQLQLWAQNGSLVAAAQDALVLNGTPDALQALIDQWSAGDFSGLPPIVLLSASDISGAMGAYAISTGKIYLNQDWLLGASVDQVNAVLTEELGHHLDGLLNAVDTPGDEGDVFSLLLNDKGNLAAQAEAASSCDTILINASDGGFLAEAAIATVSASASTASNTAFTNARRLKIVVSGSWTSDSSMEWIIGGRYWSSLVSNFYTSGGGSYSTGFVATQLTYFLNQKYSDFYTFTCSGLNITGALSGSSPKSGSLSISANGGYSASLTFYSDTGSSSYSLPITYKASESAQATIVGQDPDGINGNSVTYQWQSSLDQLNWTSTGVTTASLPLSNAYQGKYIRVNIRYSDNSGFAESVYSTNSYVVFNVNQGDGVAGAISAQGAAAFNEGVILVAGVVTGDPDGDASNPNYSYQWLLDGNVVSGATGSTYSTSATGFGSYSVQETYTDAQGFTATVTSGNQSVAKIDNGQGILAAITGNGTFQEGVTLSAGAISGDPDGTATPTAYQWYLNGSAISGATSAAYTVNSTAYGTYKVAVTYADAQGFSSTLTSADQLVAKVDNGQGILAAISGNGTFQEGVTLSARAITGDPDGAATPTAYQWYLNGSAISGATSAAYAVNSIASGTYKVAVTYADAQGFSATLTSADQTVAKVDNGQGSLAAISGNGTFQEGVTLSAGAISGDPDGAATPTGYQWYLNGSAISGATASTYAVGATGTGTYKVAVTYADAQGFSATLTSADQLVSKIDNGQGSLAAISGNGAFQEGVTLSAGAITGDPDGAATPTAYQWYLNGSAIRGATSAAYAVNSTAYGTYKVAVTYADAQGFGATLTSADQTVAKIDNGQGSLAAITGNGAFQEGVTLSAGAITGDPDGAATPTAYQWYLNGSAISGATSAAYAVNSTAYGTYKVAVTYADAQGFSSTLTSADQLVAKVDNGQGSLAAITGNGTFQEGVTLSAGAISGDPDGAATPTAYQWYLNGSAISGATSAAYTVNSTAYGTYKVAVTYSDAQGFSATLTSADQTVAKIDNGQGSLAAISGNGAFQEGVTLSAGAITGDPDGAATPTAYQWYLNGSAISGATSAAYAVNSTAYGTYKVAVTYADAQGFSATLTSADQLVAKIDNGQGSLAAISGNGAFQESVTLSAGAISGDPDGAATPTAYQWYLNGSAISGATSAAYAVNSTAYGTYKVAVTYSDAQGFSSTLTSADQLVAKIDNGQGSLAAISGNGAFQEGVTLSAGGITGDPDGAATPTAYQWYLNGSAISGATSAAYAVGATGTGTYKVAVTYADAQGFSATLTSADQLVAKIDNGQGSLAAISGNGAFQEGVTLSAGAISGDPDGAATPTAYQWYLNGSLISGATASTYAVGATGTGTYKVAVTYADAQGFSATLISADQTVAKIDNGQGIVGITGTTTVGSVLSATAVSGDPEGLASAPAYSYTWLRNGSVISGAISSNYTLASADLGSQISVRVGYTDGQGYAASATSASTVPISSPLDTVSPSVTAMAVQGSTISLTFSEPITGTSLTAANYVVAVAATPRTISAISLDATANNKLLLTLSGTAPTAAQSLTVAYALPAGNPSNGIVTDLAGNPLQSFTTRPVDTFVSTSAIGSSSSPLQADYINATLTGSSGVNVYGNAQNNTINGNDANNALYGAAGNDSIKGNGGNDSLYGGAGVDSLTGGLGSDAFYFDSKPATFSTTTVDHVTDFNTNQSDKISFGKSAYGFTSTSISLLTISSSTQLSTALASTNVFIYDGSQGLLYWNQNGATSGAGTGGIVAVLDAQAGIYPLLAASNLAIA